MTSMSSFQLRFIPSGLSKRWDTAAAEEELVSSIVTASLCALLFAFVGLLWFVANVHVTPSLWRLPIIFAAAVLTFHYCTVRFRPDIATALGFVLALQLGSFLGAANGYLVYSAGARFPLIDAQLHAIDQAMGFDWLTMLHWFGRHPILAKLTQVTYDLAPLQIAVALPFLVLVGQNDRLMKLVSAQLIALVIVHIVAIFAPAIGAYGYLGLTASDHPGMILTSEGHTAIQVMQLRTGALFDLSSAPMMGLLTFPSFHTVLAIQSAWSFWQLRIFRWPAVIFNLSVWVGTLLHGSHHLIDTIAGAAVAICSIYAACKLTAAAQRQLYGRRPVA
ncbi:phosphatase PAP2 family protein [Sphingopyxis sp.]|uniref:phosphatase PAP2 family protein n=1 Tax=Sphingopyxis sp. TaxID=1908224 RepID=UPI003D0C65D0